MQTIDPALFRNALELVRPSDIVWDIGANVGLFAFAASALAGPTGQVVAFEPDVWLVQLLRRSASCQSGTSSPVTIVSAAVGSGVALRQFKIARRSRASNSFADYIGSSVSGGVQSEQTVPAFNLDWLLASLPAPSIVKCDVEGAEFEVFDRQETLLSEVRPSVICEVCGEASASMTSVFSKFDYRMFDGDKSLVDSKEILRASWNTIAIPRERNLNWLWPKN